MPGTWSGCSGGLSGTTSEQAQDWPRLSLWEQPCGPQHQSQESRAGSRAESAQWVLAYVFGEEPSPVVHCCSLICTAWCCYREELRKSTAMWRERPVRACIAQHSTCQRPHRTNPCAQCPPETLH